MSTYGDMAHEPSCGDIGIAIGIGIGARAFPARPMSLELGGGLALQGRRSAGTPPRGGDDMAQLIYSMITSLDGYAEAADGNLGVGAEDPEVHTFIGDVFRDVGTYLYGRRMYETMVFWETAHTDPDAPPHIVQYARDWQAADKVVYSTTLESVSSARTRIERTFDPDAVRRLKADATHDLSVDGPNLAAQAVRAGLVDEYHLFVTTSAVGGGKRFFPDGVRLDLELVEHRSFGSGLIYARYRNQG